MSHRYEQSQSIPEAFMVPASHINRVPHDLKIERFDFQSFRYESFPNSSHSAFKQMKESAECIVWHLQENLGCSVTKSAYKKERQNASKGRTQMSSQNSDRLQSL